MSDKQSVVTLTDETISYANTRGPVLKDISLSIQRGEHVAIAGPSGVGKTTLLKRLFKEISDKAAFVHQDFSLVEQLSVYHNIYMGRLDYYSTFHNLLNLFRPFKMSIFAVKKITEQLAISEILFKRVDQVSGGQKQRTAIARALFNGSDCILADEPVSSIDQVNAEKILTRLTDSSLTLVASMHNVSFALKYFSRIIGLKEGRIFFDLPRSDITTDQLQKLYNQ